MPLTLRRMRSGNVKSPEAYFQRSFCPSFYKQGRFLALQFEEVIPIGIHLRTIQGEILFPQFVIAGLSAIMNKPEKIKYVRNTRKMAFLL